MAKRAACLTHDDDHDERDRDAENRERRTGSKRDAGVRHVEHEEGQERVLDAAPEMNQRVVEFLALEQDLRRALLYGSVMGSFAVEGFGTDGLERATPDAIEERARALARMITL